MNPVNFRQLGGIAGSNGKTVRHNRLLRSGELYQIDDEGRRILSSSALRTVVDFRSSDEVQKHPDDRLPGTSYRHIDILKSVLAHGSFEDLFVSEDGNSADKLMLDIYGRFVTDTDAQTGYGEFLRILAAEEEGAVLFHCFAGKDRTGFAAALVLSLLDVPRTAIVEDYLKTNAQRHAANEVIFRQARQQGASDTILHNLKTALTVREGYLNHAFDLAEHHFGGMTGYARSALHFSDGDIGNLQKLYLR